MVYSYLVMNNCYELSQVHDCINNMEFDANFLYYFPDPTMDKILLQISVSGLWSGVAPKSDVFLLVRYLIVKTSKNFSST